jgi:SulP family sulfate permease
MVRSLHSIVGGLAASVLALAYCFSYAALIFAGPLQPFLPEGIAAALITTAVTATIVALTSSFRSTIAGPDSNTAALLASMMATLAPTMATMSFAAASLLALTALSAATLVTGLALFLLGWQRLGKLVRFVPYPVVAGFLAATGWLMLSGALNMVTGIPLSWATLPSFAERGTVLIVGGTTVWAALLWFLTTRWKNPLVLPLALVAAVIATHIVVLLLALSGTAIDASMVFFSLPGGGHPVVPLVTGDLAHFDWIALAPVAGQIIAVVVLAVLSILLNSTSIELATEHNIDLDRELRMQGLANVASALAGGFVGHVSVSRTLVNIAAGGSTRLSGVVVGLVALGILFIGTQAVSFIPRLLLGGVLLQLGMRLIWDWGLLSRRSLPLLDWLIVLAIILITSTFGFLEALLFGMVAGCVIFAVDVSRIRVIRHQFGLDERTSSRVRSREESAILLEHGGQIQVLELSGYLFFGSAYSLLERVSRLIAERPPKEMIFHFSGVTGIDSSAGAAFTRISDLLRKNGISQVMVGVSRMSPAARGILTVSAGVDQGGRRHEHLDTALEEAEETILATYGVATDSRGSMVDLLTEVLGSREHAQALFDRMTPAKRDADSYLCRQGDPTDTLLFIERGPVGVMVEQRNLPAWRARVFGAYTLVGEVGFFLNAPRSASLLAAPDAIVWSLSRQAFDEFMQGHPAEGLALTTYVIRLLSERLTFANRQVASLLR